MQKKKSQYRKSPSVGYEKAAEVAECHEVAPVTPVAPCAFTAILGAGDSR